MKAHWSLAIFEKKQKINIRIVKNHIKFNFNRKAQNRPKLSANFKKNIRVLFEDIQVECILWNQTNRNGKIVTTTLYIHSTDTLSQPWDLIQTAFLFRERHGYLGFFDVVSVFGLDCFEYAGRRSKVWNAGWGADACKKTHKIYRC